MKAGFSLVEILSVLAIMSLVAVVSLNSLSSIGSAYNLTTASNNVRGALNFARQESATLNATVEFRVYRYSIAGVAGEPSSYHAYQLFQDVATSASSTGMARPLTRVQLLPGRIIFSSNATLSPALASGSPIPGSTPAPAPLPASYEYEVFHFRPNGSNDLGAANFLTLVDGASAGNQTVPPLNYATIQIDSLSSAVTELRPGG